MEKIKYQYLIAIVVLFVACAKSATSTSSSTKYEEDLTAFRPKYEVKAVNTASTDSKKPTSVEPKEHNNIVVEEKLSLIREKNKSIKYTQGYRIQVYSGSSQEAAEKAKEGIYRLDPNLDPEVIYFPPNFKVKVGSYYDRVEAYETLLKVRESFPQALLLPERVTIK